MYYLTPHVPKYCQPCRAMNRHTLAEVELRDSQNALVNYYCKEHGGRACDALNREVGPDQPREAPIPPANRPRRDRG